MTLRSGDREYYYKCLDRHFPGLKEIYTKKYGLDYEVPSDNGGRLLSIIKSECSARGIMSEQDEIFAYLYNLPDKFQQLSIFL